MQKFTQNALTGPAHRPGEKGEKNEKKHGRQTAELKTRTREAIPLFFLTYLGGDYHRTEGIR
jgi:hypothetical protein